MWFERITLRLGSEGPPVVALRRLLRRLSPRNAFGPPDAAPAPGGPLQASAEAAAHFRPDDAPFDAALADTVRRFQAAHGLFPDGIVGPATWRRLLEVFSGPKTQPDSACELRRDSPALAPSLWAPQQAEEMAVHVHISIFERRLALHTWTNDGPQARWRVHRFPVAVGRPQSPTRPGVYTVRELIDRPGPPLGVRWIRLQPHVCSIHGADEPWRVGRAATCGCVQLYNKDVEFIFHRLSPGTPVVIE